MDLGSIGDAIGDSVARGIAVLGTVVLIGVALFYFLVDSTVEDAIKGACGKALSAMGYGSASITWTILWGAVGIVGVVLFASWAVSELRDSL